MIKRISYLGLGTMGSGMASNLLKAGYELSVWNRSGEKCKPFARKGARVADSPADAARDVDLVIYMLSNDQAVEEVVFGANGILNGIEKFGESLRSPIPALRVVEKNLASAVSLGFGNENASALIKALEKEAGVQVKASTAS